MKLRQQKSLIFGMVFGSLLVASQSALASKPDSLGYSAVGLGHATTMNGPSWTLAATHPAGLLSCTEKTLVMATHSVSSPKRSNPKQLEPRPLKVSKADSVCPLASSI